MEQRVEGGVKRCCVLWGKDNGNANALEPNDNCFSAFFSMSKGFFRSLSSVELKSRQESRHRLAIVEWELSARLYLVKLWEGIGFQNLCAS
jgi:hypothetical protein